MKKPEKWEDIEPVMGGYEKIEPGGYVCKIVDAQITKTKKSNRDMIMIAIDIAKGPHTDFYAKQYQYRKEQDDKEPDKPKTARWGGIIYQLTDGESLGHFKGILINIENANPGYQWNWDESTLKGKNIGVVFGEKEFIKANGSLGTVAIPMYINDINGIEKTAPPPIRKLENNGFGTFLPADEETPF